MKIGNGKTKTKARASLAGMCIALALASCSNLQDSLSSEMEAKLLEETGTPALAGNTWYYNGTATTDVSASTNSYLDIEFGKKVALEALSGSFTISYTDSQSSKTVTTERDLAGGMFNENSDGYYLDMSPVVEFLDGSTVSKGTLSVTVKASGFVCDEGNQKGRKIGSFESKVSVKPLYTKTSGFKFMNTASQLEIPLNGEISLDEDACLTVSGAPAGASFKLGGVSDDKKSILIDASGLSECPSFAVDFNISGIRASTAGVSYSQNFSLTISDGAPISPIVVDATGLGTDIPATATVDADEFTGLSSSSVSALTIALSNKVDGTGDWANACYAVDGAWKGNIDWDGSVTIEDTETIDWIIKNGLFLFGSGGGSCTVTISW